MTEAELTAVALAAAGLVCVVQAFVRGRQRSGFAEENSTRRAKGLATNDKEERDARFLGVGSFILAAVFMIIAIALFVML